MDNIVVVMRGSDKRSAFDELLARTRFFEVLAEAQAASGKDRAAFRIAIKPNIMVFINRRGHEATVTDRELVEHLIDRARAEGYRDISVCESETDVNKMLKNHNLKFIAEQVGYQPRGRYAIVDLTDEAVPYAYAYEDEEGRLRKWKDKVGKTWMAADFRITFAKCKTHEHDFLTLGVKNVYGCSPRANKIARYHILSEVWDVTARSLRNFPVHFSFVDAWIASDGFQGYKNPSPKELKMLFGGNNVVAVDMEIFKRAGLDYHQSKMLGRAVEQLYHGAYPAYRVEGDTSTLFSDICPWKNIDEKIVAEMDSAEEIYLSWGILNLKPTVELADFEMVPPKNIVYRLAVWFMIKLYSVFKLTRLYRRLYGDRRGARLVLRRPHRA